MGGKKNEGDTEKQGGRAGGRELGVQEGRGKGKGKGRRRRRQRVKGREE